jgi:photosystem I P700 chlorophyll a apoprotein A2
LADDVKIESPEVLEAVSDLKAKRTGFAIIVDLKSDVLFDFNKADIKPEAAASLAKVALIIKKKARGRVLIEGHTDSVGTDEYNQKLSERRAEAVRRWLADRHGINPDIMAVKGWGEARPVAPNTNPDGSDNPAGRALNRRVVITIPTAGSKDRPKTP